MCRRNMFETVEDRVSAPVDSSFQLRKLIGLPSENIGILYCIVSGIQYNVIKYYMIAT